MVSPVHNTTAATGGGFGTVLPCLWVKISCRWSFVSRQSTICSRILHECVRSSTGTLPLCQLRISIGMHTWTVRHFTVLIIQFMCCCQRLICVCFAASRSSDPDTISACVTIKTLNPNIRILAQVAAARTRDVLRCLPGWNVHKDTAIAVQNMNAALLGKATNPSTMPSNLLAGFRQRAT